MSDGRAPTLRFGDRAKAYAAYRPSYPAEAIDAVLAGLGDPQALEIADVGAGTGISARLFADRGAHVVAIEPNAEMRRSAMEHPRVDWRDATAEQTGLADSSVDVVTACQAFHWFATDIAMREFRRIARCRVALVQHERDEGDPFTKAYGDIVRSYAQDDTETLRRRALETFAALPSARVMREVFTFRQSVDLDGVLGRAASSSYLPNTGPEAESLRRDLSSIFERYERAGCVEIAMVTFVLVADFSKP